MVYAVFVVHLLIKLKVKIEIYRFHILLLVSHERNCFGLYILMSSWGNDARVNIVLGNKYYFRNIPLLPKQILVVTFNPLNHKSCYSQSHSFFISDIFGKYAWVFAAWHWQPQMPRHLEITAPSQAIAHNPCKTTNLNNI